MTRAARGKPNGGGVGGPSPRRGLHQPLGGVLLYKCRECGHDFDGLRVPDLALTLTRLADDTPLPESWGAQRPAMMAWHECKNVKDTWGLADLVGGKPDSQPAA